MLDLMDIKPKRKKCNTRHVLLYAFPTASGRNRSYRPTHIRGIEVSKKIAKVKKYLNN